MDEPVLFTQVYATVRYLHEIAPRMSKVHRPTLVRRLLETALDLLAATTDLRFTKERTALFHAADRHLDGLRVLARLCHDLKLLATKQYERIAEELSAAGRMLGGWRRNT
jgi:hypothetical protein